MTQGASAVESGKDLELLVEETLLDLEINFNKQIPYKNIYGKNARMDFFIPKLNLAIDCKNQQVSGTADQKLPFVLENLKLFNSVKSLLVLGGLHYYSNEGIANYLNSNKTTKVDWLFIGQLKEYLKNESSKIWSKS